MSPFIFIISALASFRLAHMFSTEKGPGDIFTAIRKAKSWPQGIRDGLECVLCESVWWAGVITVYLGILGVIPWSLSPIYWLATSAAACVIHFQFSRE